jgi:hypothetical protein
VHSAFAIGHIADAASAIGDAYEAALLSGYANRQLQNAESERMLTEQRGHERVLRRCRDALGNAGLKQALAEGAVLDGRDAVALALAATAQMRDDVLPSGVRAGAE